MEGKLPKEVVEYLKTQGNAIFPNGETYGYYRSPWIMLEQGTDVAKFFWGTEDMPSEIIDHEVENALWVLKHLASLEQLKKLEESGQLKLDFKDED